jgi:hypothetical protein
LTHEGLNYLLVLLGKSGVALGVSKEQLLIDLERVDAFANPAVAEVLPRRQIRTELED